MPRSSTDQLLVAVIVRRECRLGAGGCLPSRAASRKSGPGGGRRAGYPATYLLPFVMAASPTGRELATWALFVGMMTVLYVQSNVIAINPVLSSQ